jgi:hypothetical protein
MVRIPTWSRSSSKCHFEQLGFVSERLVVFRLIILLVAEWAVTYFKYFSYLFYFHIYFCLQIVVCTEQAAQSFPYFGHATPTLSFILRKDLQHEGRSLA